MYLVMGYKKRQTSSNRLTALSCPCVEDLVGMASPVGEEPVLTVVVEGTRVVQRLVVTSRLSTARVLALSCNIGYAEIEKKCCRHIQEEINMLQQYRISYSCSLCKYS